MQLCRSEISPPLAPLFLPGRCLASWLLPISLGLNLYFPLLPLLQQWLGLLPTPPQRLAAGAGLRPVLPLPLPLLLLRSQPGRASRLTRAVIRGTRSDGAACLLSATLPVLRCITGANFHFYSLCTVLVSTYRTRYHYVQNDFCTRCDPFSARGSGS